MDEINVEKIMYKIREEIKKRGDIEEETKITELDENLGIINEKCIINTDFHPIPSPPSFPVIKWIRWFIGKGIRWYIDKIVTQINIFNTGLVRLLNGINRENEEIKRRIERLERLIKEK